MRYTPDVPKELKDDIDSAYIGLIKSTNLEEQSNIISEASNYIEQHLHNLDYSKELIDGFKSANKLIALIKSTEDTTLQIIGVAALKYLIDPWDVIPDLISEEGFIDDIYIIYCAINAFEDSQCKLYYENKLIAPNAEQVNSGKLIEILGGASGPHLAKISKELNILDSYKRRALFDIGRKYMFGYDISKKQASFFDVLISRAVKEGITATDCNCQYCNKVRQTFNSDERSEQMIG